jgi:hypothetical protein
MLALPSTITTRSQKAGMYAPPAALGPKQANLGQKPAHLALQPEDAARAAPAREHLELVGDARAGGVDQVDHRAAHLQRLLLDADDLLHGPAAPGARLHRRVVGHQGHDAPADAAQTGDHAVGG